MTSSMVDDARVPVELDGKGYRIHGHEADEDITVLRLRADAELANVI